MVWEGRDLWGPSGEPDTWPFNGSRVILDKAHHAGMCREGTCQVRSNQGSDQAGALVSGGSGGTVARQTTEPRTPGLLSRFCPTPFANDPRPTSPSPLAGGAPSSVAVGWRRKPRPALAKSGARRCCQEAQSWRFSLFPANRHSSVLFPNWKGAPRSLASPAPRPPAG